MPDQAPADNAQPTPDTNCTELLKVLSESLANCEFDEMFVVVRKTTDDVDYAAYFTPYGDIWSVVGFTQNILTARVAPMLGEVRPVDGGDDE